MTVDLDTITLAKGAHDSPEHGMCVMEAVAYVAGEPFSDHPKCVSPVLGTFLRRWNDDLDEEGRQRLKAFVPRVIGTAGDGHDELRGWLCVDWLVRTYTPAWLELAGITDAAAALRTLPPIRDLDSVAAARPAIVDAHRKGAAAWAAAWDAACGTPRRAAAWAAAWDAARDALKPTTERLQQSALELLEWLIDPSAQVAA